MTTLRIGNSQGSGFRVQGSEKNKFCTLSPVPCPLKSGFTLIEVLTAVVILSFGIIGVIRAYVSLMNGIETAHFTVETAYLLKDKASDIEREAIENSGLAPGARSGSFSEEYDKFSWQMEAARVVIENNKAKEGKIGKNMGLEGNGPAGKKEEEPEETLTKVKLSVSCSRFTPPRKLSLYTYMEGPSE